MKRYWVRKHPDTKLALSYLASTYSALAQHDKALPLQLRALAINEKILGPEHPDTARTLNNVAYTYGALAQHDKGLPLKLRFLGDQRKGTGSTALGYCRWFEQSGIHLQ
jgi:tetratricopeptide (TPR) repeat protein